MGSSTERGHGEGAAAWACRMGSAAAWIPNLFSSRATVQMSLREVMPAVPKSHHRQSASPCGRPTRRTGPARPEPGRALVPGREPDKRGPCVGHRLGGSLSLSAWLRQRKACQACRVIAARIATSAAWSAGPRSRLVATTATPEPSSWAARMFSTHILTTDSSIDALVVSSCRYRTRSAESTPDFTNAARALLDLPLVGQLEGPVDPAIGLVGGE
jgi:hypothetical protein